MNLLKMQVEPPTVWTKLYDWIVSTSRIVVIFVELLVIVAFAIRLVVDIQSKRLDGFIEDKEQILLQWKVKESAFRKIQAKTNAFQKSWILSPAYNEIFKEINKHVPQNADEINVKVDKEAISISGTATNLEVGTLETALKNNPNFVGTEVKQIESSSSNPTDNAEFVITTKIKNIKARSIAGSST